MAIECNQIQNVANELIDKFSPCYKLKADDMDTIVELIIAVESCVSAGTGFMLASTYDNSGVVGIVDNAEKVNDLTVETAVPAGALFTDTVYDDTAIQADVDGKEEDLSNPSQVGMVLTSDVAGNRAWVEQAAGTGDMTELEYATNGTPGVVDNAVNSDTVNSLTVQTAVPSGALFTDTVYDDTSVEAHMADTSSNPHAVDKSDVGLSNVDNVSDADKPVSTATQSALDLKADDSDLTSHVGNTANPHGVDATDVGLSNVNNTSDANKPVSTATQNELDDKGDKALVLNDQVGTSYSLVDADLGKLITLSNASAITLTVADTLSLALGSQIHLLNKGAGQVTVAVSGATVNSAETLKLREQWSMATLIQIATDNWVLTGDLELS